MRTGVRVSRLTAGLLAAAAAATAAGLVTAQEAALPPIPTPPEESVGDPEAPPPAPPPGDQAAPPPAGVPDPAPYTVLGPDSRRAQAEVEAAPPPLEEVLPEVVEAPPVEPGPPPPLPRRPRHPGAIVQVLDKVTAETLRFEVGAGRPVRWKSLVFRANACETEAINEPLKEATAHLAVTSEPGARPGRAAPEAAQVFRGWMFASSPGLNPFEHPVYDVWLVGCRLPPPPAPAANAPGAAGPAGDAPGATAPSTRPGSEGAPASDPGEPDEPLRRGPGVSTIPS